ncbi:hypothetical protein DENSPDRAFT_685137 [Dentipellis sp. KUC8613]|nr:hypothetical protein DENSPDRAFT_685137 [Dentipellis sp. KUC8613]
MPFHIVRSAPPRVVPPALSHLAPTPSVCVTPPSRVPRSCRALSGPPLHPLAPRGAVLRPALLSRLPGNPLVCRLTVLMRRATPSEPACSCLPPCHVLLHPIVLYGAVVARSCTPH